MLIEICVDGLQNALAASQGFPDSIELCANLSVGGITPSVGVIATACRLVPTPVRLLIRTRGGNFVPDENEFDAMLRDIASAHSLGCAGVVLGVLDKNGRPDRERMLRLIDAARPIEITFHRAFDHVDEPVAALENVIDWGVDRILTSGRPGAARDHLGLLGSLVKRAAGRIRIAVAGQVTREDLPALAALGVEEVHIGSAARGPDGQVDTERVRAFVHCAHGFTR